MKRLADIQALVSLLFSTSWAGLHKDDSLAPDELKFPSVYLLAHTETGIEGSTVLAPDVFYVGMSNSAGGVRQRLKQFKMGIEKNNSHSGAMRFYRDYCVGRPYSLASTGKKIYFAALTLPCASRKELAGPDDFRVMGHIACLEYYAMAHIEQETGRRPALNKIGTLIQR